MTIVEILIEGKYQNNENAMELHRQLERKFTKVANKMHDCKIVFKETVSKITQDGTTIEKEVSESDIYTAKAIVLAKSLY